MKFIEKFFPIFILILALPIQGCTTTYSAKKIEARVIDADTKQPLEGVNVVAQWTLEGGMEGGVLTNLMLMESVSDKDGRFYFPAWGPKSIPSDLPWNARLKNQDPGMVMFKSGYEVQGFSNEITGPYPGTGPSMRTSQWNSKTIELKRHQGNLERYRLLLDGVLGGIFYGECRWKNIPRMIVALDKESARLRKLGVRISVITISRIEDNSARENCGSAQEFFKDYIE
ncbi:Carboxypeptidase regulatory-like domain-containing protein [Candidatus Nitrotoga sp. HW29]|uniref:carboxypeptidase-like regulatory domain-containing protein n=1 Tax=Candidatus Nitrotoga sp. HW29 TaxID=2886963 RepID=UPI001EF20A8E|nr:carboxypeptidase-like regulatory domain-containing protein [Candidatus Nitrotoga sp. HW29]CAH1904479.1 Carboxypeptidase regulatory-like domain-containing protein [Candidatus Nitrotoga sp. HW29]